MTPASPVELLAVVVARLLHGCRHVAVGMASPIPGAGALLARTQSAGATRVTVLGAERDNFFTSGGVELFDLAAQGRIDAFFLGGGQIDGSANVNLVGVGGYPELSVRWPGSYGSSYMYYLVPRVILFREEHTRRVFVPRVDFISAAGTSPAGVYRRGGPHALLTGRGLFSWQPSTGRFLLQSVHPGHTVEEIHDHTGFDFDVHPDLHVTPAASAAELDLLRGAVWTAIRAIYPVFAARHGQSGQVGRSDH